MPLYDQDGCPVCTACAARLRWLLNDDRHALTPTERPDDDTTTRAPLWCSHCRQVIR